MVVFGNNAVSSETVSKDSAPLFDATAEEDKLRVTNNSRVLTCLKGSRSAISYVIVALVCVLVEVGLAGVLHRHGAGAPKEFLMPTTRVIDGIKRRATPVLRE